MFRGHHVISATIGLAGNQRHHRNRRLGIGKQQFRAVLDDAAIFLRRSGQETGHIHQCQQGNVEGIAEAHEAGGLA
ncbi:hypothetical protein D3C87_1801930 [compost metagenome]